MDAADPGLDRELDAPPSDSTLGRTDEEIGQFAEPPSLLEERQPNTSWWARMKGEMTRVTMHFPPSWFSVNMGTGITSVLLHEMPYQAQWLHYLSYIVFALNVFLFVLFLGISIVRYARWPVLLRLLLRHPAQSMFLGTFSMGFSTIINMAVLVCVPRWGHGFTMFMWALWWLNSAIALAMGVALPILQFTRHSHELSTVTGVLLLPVVTTVVIASTGANVADVLPPNHAKLTLTVSYILWGAGFCIAMLCFALFYARLTIHKIPPAALIVTIFLPLGTCGQAAYGLLRFSAVINKLSVESGQSLFGASEATASEARIMALALYGVTVPVALIIWGLAFAWLIIAVGLLFDLWLVSKLTFNLGWWGFTFPIGTFTTATTQLAKEFNSEAFRVLGTLFSIVEILLWIAIGSLTFYRAVKGEIFVSPCLAETGGQPPKEAPFHRQYEYQPRFPRKQPAAQDLSSPA